MAFHRQVGSDAVGPRDLLLVLGVDRLVGVCWVLDVGI